MNGIDLLKAAVTNSFRSKTRTILTVIAIFIGAFTLTLTSGVGTGINQYIDTTVASIGAKDVMTVTKAAEDTGDGPREYDPETTRVAPGMQAGPPTASVEAIDSADLTELRDVTGVLSAEPVLSVRPTFIEGSDDKKFEVSVGATPAGITLQLAAGEQPDWNSDDFEVAVPESFVKPLGFDTNKDSLGETVTFGVTDATGAESTIDATIVAVTERGLAAGTSVSANDSLTRALYDAQSTGLTAEAADSYPQAVIRFDEAATPEQVDALQQRLTDLGYTSQTVEDQIGAFKTVIDGIILVLNAFAIIALIAAGFGIINTLLMSVQERTREIGLMKAMGLGAGRIFTLFSLEAVFIGFLGSAIGAGIAMIVGTLANNALATGLLADLPGLSLVAFAPASIATIIGVVMVIAFIAGTIPALRAARQDPIESLRYE